MASYSNEHGNERKPDLIMQAQFVVKRSKVIDEFETGKTRLDRMATEVDQTQFEILSGHNIDLKIHFSLFYLGRVLLVQRLAYTTLFDRLNV